MSGQAYEEEKRRERESPNKQNKKRKRKNLSGYCRNTIKAKKYYKQLYANKFENLE